MRVIETDDILAALAAFALNADEFPGIDVIAVVWRILARVAAACDARDALRALVFELPEQHAAALVGIGFFSVLTKGEVVGLRELEHQNISPRRHGVTSHGENQANGLLRVSVVKSISAFVPK